MPKVFNVSLVLENVELTDQDVARIFEALPDAVPAQIGGVVTVTSPVEAGNAEGAAFRLVDAVGTALPHSVASRLDQDLVSIPGIAERTDRSRESIRLLVEGKRGPGGFPSPVGTVGDCTRIWPWAVVLEWFANKLGEDLGELAVPPDVAAVVDACLATRKQHFVHRPCCMNDRQGAGKVGAIVDEASVAASPRPEHAARSDRPSRID